MQPKLQVANDVARREWFALWSVAKRIVGMREQPAGRRRNAFNRRLRFVRIVGFELSAARQLSDPFRDYTRGEGDGKTRVVSVRSAMDPDGAAVIAHRGGAGRRWHG
jgi:hypothetical protein